VLQHGFIIVSMKNLNVEERSFKRTKSIARVWL